MKYAATAMASATMVALTNAHGFITKPAARMPGDAMQQACGMQVYYNQKGDNYGNVQGELQVASSQDDYNEKACNIWMCKGYKYADNTENVQKWTVGQSVPITVDIRAPHTGTANVSIVETATNSMVGSILKHWDVYASTATTIPEGQKQFDITIPELNGKCTQPGACVLQWWWDAHSIDQTYESCIDFTVSGGSGSKAVVTSAQQVAATTKAPVASSTSETPVASTCACSPAKRDALPQQAYGSASSCSAETSTTTITRTATATATITETASASAGEKTITITQTATATVTDTITLQPSSSVAAAAETASLSAPSSVAAVATGVSASTSKCTTSITLTRGASAGVSGVAGAGTGAPFPYPVANATIAPTASAPSVSLAPVYSSALANITSSVADAAMTSVVPSASVNPLISSYLANITSVLPTGAIPVGTAAPTGLPAGYITVTSAPQATAGASSPPSYGGSDAAPAQGMTLKQIFEWIAYLMKQVFQDGEKKGEAEAAAPAASSSVAAAAQETAPAAYGKRSHARSFMG